MLVLRCESVAGLKPVPPSLVTSRARSFVLRNAWPRRTRRSGYGEFASEVAGGSSRPNGFVMSAYAGTDSPLLYIPLAKTVGETQAC